MEKQNYLAIQIFQFSANFLTPCTSVHMSLLLVASRDLLDPFLPSASVRSSYPVTALETVRLVGERTVTVVRPVCAGLPRGVHPFEKEFACRL